MTQRPVDDEWLKEKYLVEQLSANDIAKIVERNPKRVWEWLKSIGIKTRRRGSNQNNWFRPGMISAFSGKKHTEEVKRLLRELRIQDGHVPYLKNGRHHLKGKRGADTPNWKGGITPQRQAFYSSEEWKAAVRAVWRRDNAICQRCKKDFRTVDRSVETFDIHHVVGFACVELRSVVDNLILFCEKCHYWVHSRENINKEFIKNVKRV